MISITRKWHTEWLEYVLHNKNTPDDWKDIVSNDNFLPEFITNIMNIGNKSSYTNNLIWSALGNNSNLSIKFILDNPQFMDKWDWKTISRNKNMTHVVINAHPELKWHWESMEQNPSVCLSSDFLTENFSKFDMQYIIPNAPFSFIEKHMVVFSYFYQERFWGWLSRNPNITGEFLLFHLNEAWSWPCLSSNPALSIDFIEDNMSLMWDWSIISKHKMTIPFYEKHIVNIFFDISDLHQNPNMIDFFLIHPDWNWNWAKISCNKGLTFSIVKSLPHKDWDWFELSRHPNITMDDISGSRFPWCFYSMSWNPNLSIGFIKRDFFKPWSRKYVLKNNMKSGREHYISTEYDKLVKLCKQSYETQLVEIAWNPNRLEWVMDEDQKERWFKIT